MALKTETEVLITGGGSVGLAMANELGWRGIDCLLVDQGDGVIREARAGAISDRTMECLRRWGVEENIYDSGFPGDYPLDTVFCTSLTGYELARYPRPGNAQMGTPKNSPVPKQRCPQMWFDPILRQGAQRFPTVEISYEQCVLDVQDDTQGITATIRNEKTQELQNVRASYHVAADGAASDTRERLNIALTGKPLLNYSLNILIESDHLWKYHNLGQASHYIMIGAHGAWADITVVDGVRLWRLTLLFEDSRIDIPSLDLNGFARRVLGSPDIPFRILSVTPWKRTELVADSFQLGRTFLVGDSAHTMSNTGGHGMNTGIGDVDNLGWKLEAALNGWAGPTLLDSYTSERRPIAQRNAAFATKDFEGWFAGIRPTALLEDSPEGEKQRAEVGRRLVDSTTSEWSSEGVALGYRYDASPICIADGSPSPSDTAQRYVPSARPGARAPHAWVTTGLSTLDLFGHGFTLLTFAADHPSVAVLHRAAQDQRVPLSVVSLCERQDIRDLYESDLVLVRPDGHVAWRGNEISNAGHLITTVRGA